MYSRFDSAYFNPSASFCFSTGFIAYYTPDMPDVINPKWKKRTILMIPLSIEYTPCNVISVQFDITDLFVEFPYEKYDRNMGGKSPRFRTKLQLLKEKNIRPSLVLISGVKWSSAKPYTMWDGKHNYQESNGLAGAGTGVADYLILFMLSKHLHSKFTLHGRLGLAPIGSPMGIGRQADEIPYGLSMEHQLAIPLNIKLEISGMYNGLPSTKRAHYSVFRTLFCYSYKNRNIALNFEKGLTEYSGQWVAGVYVNFTKYSYGVKK